MKIDKKDRIRRYITLESRGDENYEVIEFYPTLRDLETYHMGRKAPIIIRGYAGQFKVGQIVSEEFVKPLIVNVQEK